MPPPKKPSRGFSFFGLTAGAGRVGAGGGHGKTETPPQLKLETDREVYRPGDLVTITVEIKNPTESFSLLVEKLSFEIKGIEKLDTNWFNIPKPPPESKQRRGEYVFMDWSTPTIVSNQIIAPGVTKRYVVRTLLPSIIPPSYRGATIRYMYYARSTISGKYLILRNGHSHRELVEDLPDLEVRIPLQIWVTQKTNGLISEESETDGIVPATSVWLDVYWKELEGDSEWTKANESFDGVEEGYESSKDDMLSVSSYNPGKEDIHRAFGSSLSLQSSLARSSSKDLSFFEARASISSNPALPGLVLPRLAVADPLSESYDGPLSSGKSEDAASRIQQLTHSRSLSIDDETRMPSVPGTVESGASEGFVRGRSYNIRLDDQVLLRFSPKNSDSTYYFSDMIGGTLTFFHEEGTRRCLELSVSLEMTETISRRFVHPSRKLSPTITKVHSDHHEVVADLLQTSFLFSVPMDGPMSFSTRYVSVQWALRFEFLTTPKNVDWTRFEHPLLIEGRDKCEWLLPITVHAPPLGAAAQIRNGKPFSLEPLWVHT
ncbi:OLC1v1015570C3 [Oldenlandia corymbosa var. corymbosa]|uniref:OLC1v1015570C3 n=1 Tax=Oldenlandia corymbosa var. corymbosa TaxID=529605 RepID=A0AAV1E3E7_OLDCO|nr:OLC1v1015570C3 [Oldenlandia corymbosa var. corymbosa]